MSLGKEGQLAPAQIGCRSMRAALPSEVELVDASCCFLCFV